MNRFFRCDRSHSGHRWHPDAADTWRPLAERLYPQAYAYTLAVSLERKLSHTIWWQLPDAGLPMGKICQSDISVPLWFSSAPLDRERAAHVLGFTKHLAPIVGVDRPVLRRERWLPVESVRRLRALVVLLPISCEPQSITPTPDCWVSDGALHTAFWLLDEPFIGADTYSMDAKLAGFAAAVGGKGINTDHQYPVPGTYNADTGRVVTLTWATKYDICSWTSGNAAPLKRVN